MNDNGDSAQPLRRQIRGQSGCSWTTRAALFPLRSVERHEQRLHQHEIGRQRLNAAPPSCSDKEIKVRVAGDGAGRTVGYPENPRATVPGDWNEVRDGTVSGPATDGDQDVPVGQRGYQAALVPVEYVQGPAPASNPGQAVTEAGGDRVRLFLTGHRDRARASDPSHGLAEPFRGYPGDDVLDGRGRLQRETVQHPEWIGVVGWHGADALAESGRFDFEQLTASVPTMRTEGPVAGAARWERGVSAIDAASAFRHPDNNHFMAPCLYALILLCVYK